MRHLIFVFIILLSLTFGFTGANAYNRADPSLNRIIVVYIYYTAPAAVTCYTV